ncbi:hypothetical protein [Microscilla marina]|uniref:Uncharacterized protein n=1 Tax=Microscilla marina ATCC 23134 TaxID=313606 RepID=A2A078_MICM2|nr:hypothetical protein [Microscilla marina]EAY23967.1 conserved hypothetical protein [Microscilla marina ATCC 23134]
MEEQELKKRLDLFERKMQKLIVKTTTLKKEMERVVEENINLKAIVRKQKEELDNFQNQENFTKLVASILTGTEDTNGLKKRLDEYIEEIDKCIALMSR